MTFDKLLDPPAGHLVGSPHAGQLGLRLLHHLSTVLPTITTSQPADRRTSSKTPNGRSLKKPLLPRNQVLLVRFPLPSRV